MYSDKIQFTPENLRDSKCRIKKVKSMSMCMWNFCCLCSPDELIDGFSPLIHTHTHTHTLYIFDTILM